MSLTQPSLFRVQGWMMRCMKSCERCINVLRATTDVLCSSTLCPCMTWAAMKEVELREIRRISALSQFLFNFNKVELSVHGIPWTFQNRRSVMNNAKCVGPACCGKIYDRTCWQAVLNEPSVIKQWEHRVGPRYERCAKGATSRWSCRVRRRDSRGRERQQWPGLSS
jgi:hypothetical protein